MLKGGNFRYYIDFYENGKRVCRSLKTSDEKTAELIVKDIEVKLGKGVWGFEERRAKKDISLKEFIDEYLEFSRANKAPRTYENDIPGRS